MDPQAMQSLERGIYKLATFVSQSVGYYRIAHVDSNPEDAVAQVKYRVYEGAV